MKKIITIVILAIIMMSFSQCSSAQLDKKTPVTITNSIYQNWVGGQPGSQGTLVSIKLNAPDKKMEFDSIYFNGKAVKLQSNLVKNPNDVIMHADPKKEFGNAPPKLAAKIPFELEKNDAIISYIINDKKRYFKVSG